MALPAFEDADFMEKIHKRKLNANEMYLLVLRQILINQACLLADKTQTQFMVGRLEEFLVYKE